uniref:Uncharacterized protein n=1 Tax=Arundo donax TaxID=35708 RepID=A0A0A9C6F4_ARUDO
MRQLYSGLVLVVDACSLCVLVMSCSALVLGCAVWN